MSNGASDECGRAEATEEPPEPGGDGGPAANHDHLPINRLELLTISTSTPGTLDTLATSPPRIRIGRNGASARTKSTNGKTTRSITGKTPGKTNGKANGKANGKTTTKAHGISNGHRRYARNGQTTAGDATAAGLGASSLLNGNSPLNGSLPLNGSSSRNGDSPETNGHASSMGVSINRLDGIQFPTASRARSGNPRTREFRKRFFPEATDREWNDWRWQSRHRIRTLEQFERMVTLSETERDALVRGGAMLPVGVTPYYMSLIDRDDPQQPLRKTVIPTTGEFVRTVGEADDPLGEDGHSPVPGLVHRYPDRVLLLPLDFCSTYCRYCTRSRVVGHGELAPNEKRLEAIFQYLEQATQVRDVLVSGGDPLALSDDKLDWILRRLRSIRHIEFVRIGTKMPAVLPQRFTPELTRVLRKYHPLWMSIHFLHPDECTPESAKACGRLADAGIPLGSQTVLLKGVNDDVETMKQLVHRLLLMRVRPYYLYQCDPISGSSHFRTPVSKGLEIIEGLRGHTTGYAVPTYVIDAPGGGGKIPLQPEYVVGREGDFLVLRNFEGKTYRYPDPVSP